MYVVQYVRVRTCVCVYNNIIIGWNVHFECECYMYVYSMCLSMHVRTYELICITYVRTYVCMYNSIV